MPILPLPATPILGRRRAAPGQPQGHFGLARSGRTREEIMSASPYKQLEQEFKRLHAFRGALSLLRWDAAVMMPRGSADIRGEQLAALEPAHHALITAP